MHTFFHGWRRKAGCVSLVVACVFVIAWMRSLFRADGVAEIGPQGSYTIYSSRGAVHVDQLVSERYFLDDYNRGRLSRPWYSPSFRWTSHAVSRDPGRRDTDSSDPDRDDMKWSLNWYGFRCREVSRSQWIGVAYRYREWVVPYWVVVWPLTLLAGYLILWKPRQRPCGTP